MRRTTLLLASLLAATACQREPDVPRGGEPASSTTPAPQPDAPQPTAADPGWPQAQGIALDSGTLVHVSRSQIRFEERTVARIVDGQVAEEHLRGAWLIDPLYELLSETANEAKTAAEMNGQPWQERVVFAADEATPFATIVKLVFTGGRAEFRGFGFVVGSPGPKLSYLPFDVPSAEFAFAAVPEGTPRLARHAKPDILSGSAAPDEFNELLSIELRRDGLTLGRGDSTRALPVAHPQGALAAVAEAAAAVRASDPTARRVVISAEGDVPLRELIEVMVAARGPECGASGDGCVLPRVILVSGHAHDYQLPASPSALPDVEVWGGLPAMPEGEAAALIPKQPGPAIPSITQPSREKVELGTPRVVGGLDPDIVRRIVRAHINELRYCYRAGLDKQPDLRGTLIVDFTIGSGGKVELAQLGGSDVADASVTSCMVRSFRRWTFPKPKKGLATVSLPLTLTPD